MVVSCFENFSQGELEAKLPARMRRDLALRKAKLYITDATKIAVKVGLGKRISMIIQSLQAQWCGALQGRGAAQGNIKKMYGETGVKVVQLNIDGINTGIAGIVECAFLTAWAELETTGAFAFAPPERPGAQAKAAALARRIQAPCNNLDGGDVPVNIFEPGGRVPLWAPASTRSAASPSTAPRGHGQVHAVQQVQPHLPARCRAPPFLLCRKELDAAPASFREGRRHRRWRPRQLPLPRPGLSAGLRRL